MIEKHGRPECKLGADSIVSGTTRRPRTSPHYLAAADRVYDGIEDTLLRVARLNQTGDATNPKRVYCLFKLHDLLLQRHCGSGAEPRHDGKIAVTTRKTRWCSDGST